MSVSTLLKTCLVLFFGKKCCLDRGYQEKYVCRNWYMLFHLIARTLKIYIPIHHAFPHNISQKVRKICEIVVYFEVIFQIKFFHVKTMKTRKIIHKVSLKENSKNNT